ncbi:MAG: PAS domain S-box protein [Clostridia bacterium]|nr:PAS domain S-box protein [Clostridia bacterium]
MFKKIQIKIVLAFAIIGIIVLSALGVTYIYNLQQIGNAVNSTQNITEINNVISNQIYQSKVLLAMYLTGFVVLMILGGIFISKVIIAPIASLVKSAEQATKSERIKYLNEGKKKNEINDLVSAFDNMNNELKENLNEATRQKKQMETILLHMTDGIIAFDINGKIIHINPAAKTFLCLDKEENFEEIFEKYDVDINLEKIIYLENWTSSEQKINVEDRTINLFFAPYKNENERPAGLIVVIQDITEHVKLDSMRKRFVADVSHELKTPITSIMGYADTLLENDVDGEIGKKFLERISTEAQRMARLVSDLLTLSRYDTSKVKAEKTEFDLGELVKYTFEGLDLEMKKKEQSGECFVTSDVPLVFADRNGIERVVLNILTNAIKYTPEKGSIKVYVGFVYNDAYIKIIDTGIGIPKEDLDKIFERFYRVDKARTREMGGTGLGLSIAKEILDQNDGMIDIKSEVGKGTEVVIRIPTKQQKSVKEKNTEE